VSTDQSTAAWLCVLSKFWHETGHHVVDDTRAYIWLAIRRAVPAGFRAVRQCCLIACCGRIDEICMMHPGTTFADCDAFLEAVEWSSWHSGLGNLCDSVGDVGQLAWLAVDAGTWDAIDDLVEVV